MLVMIFWVVLPSSYQCFKGTMENHLHNYMASQSIKSKLTVNWKRHGWEQSCPNIKYWLRICLWELKKTMKSLSGWLIYGPRSECRISGI